MSKFTPKFEKSLNEWIKHCQSLINDYFTSMFPNLKIPEIIFTKGIRYVKVILKDAYGSQRVWAFIDINTGDVYKPACWRAPAKHVRGNLYTESGKTCVSCYGVVSLR